MVDDKNISIGVNYPSRCISVRYNSIYDENGYCIGYVDPLTGKISECTSYIATSPIQQKDEPALRYDHGKLRYDLLPFDGLEELTKVYTKGAEKYADRNWEKGMSWSRCVGSLLRHTFRFCLGERNDPETGLHHMAHAAWNAIALCVYDLRQVGTDDRVLGVSKSSSNNVHDKGI